MLITVQAKSQLTTFPPAQVEIQLLEQPEEQLESEQPEEQLLEQEVHCELPHPVVQLSVHFQHNGTTPTSSLTKSMFNKSSTFILTS